MKQSEMQSMNEEYKTSDLGLSTALVVWGGKINRLERVKNEMTGKQQVAFVFETGNTDIQGLVKNYYDGTLPVDALEYNNASRMLKKRLFQFQNAQI